MSHSVGLQHVQPEEPSHLLAGDGDGPLPISLEHQQCHSPLAREVGQGEEEGTADARCAAHPPQSGEGKTTATLSAGRSPASRTAFRSILHTSAGPLCSRPTKSRPLLSGCLRTILHPVRREAGAYKPSGAS